MRINRGISDGLSLDFCSIAGFGGRRRRRKGPATTGTLIALNPPAAAAFVDMEGSAPWAGRTLAEAFYPAVSFCGPYRLAIGKAFSAARRLWLSTRSAHCALSAAGGALPMRSAVHQMAGQSQPCGWTWFKF